MNKGKVLVIDNDTSAGATILRLLSGKFMPQLLIGLQELEPIMKGYDHNVKATDLVPQQFPPVAFVADTLGGILTPTDEIMRVLHTRKVCCIATTTTKLPTLAHADFGINRLNLVDWIPRWLQPIHTVASKQKPGPIGIEAGKRKILVVNQSAKFCLSMVKALASNKYPCLEPFTEVLRLGDDTIKGKNTSGQEVEIRFDELAVLFVAGSWSEGSDQVLARTIVHSASAVGVCCVSTSYHQSQILPEADFMIDESRYETFVALWMQAIYPTACNTVRRD